ncbi:MAG: biotin/lipoate A/B protein ligase family protein [Aggregatilineales bacterium]
MGETWRLILDAPCDGHINMARDEAILRAVARGDQPPTLRLYAWRVPTLSLGYAQPSADADLSRLRERGWGLVRRPSGGRAILHADEITYSVTFPESHPLAQGGVIESYRRLSAALIAALRSLAPAMPIEADQRHARAAAPNAICFEVPSDYEITARGKKLIGSAQMRKYGGVLQHGALPLGGDVAAICEALAFSDENARQRAKQRVRERAITLSEAAGAPIAWETAAEALCEGFRRAFGLSWRRAERFPEADAAHDLALSRYAADAWTFAR